MNLNDYLQARRKLVDRTLDANLPPADTAPPIIHEAMRYAVLGGGKRLRPILAMVAAETLGADVEPILKHICALELIHTYSLVHDDLPALDNDDLRRGRKTTHIVYGEAMGVLVGDALLTEAFSWLAKPVAGLASERQLRAIAEVAVAVDSTGMIGGQVADIVAERSHEGPNEKNVDREALLRELHFIHRNKTGKLFTASLVLGGLLAGASEEQLGALRRYADALGLAFQIVDDLLDIEESSATLGKTAGKDIAQGKLTWPALLGAESARAEVRRLEQEALENADTIAGPVNYLAPIARFICERRS